MNKYEDSGFTQVCVWPGTLLSESQIPEFEQFFLDDFGVRVKFLESVVTGPDYEEGRKVDGTGGRHDVLFAVHREDIGKFALPRFQIGVRWIEDVLDNEEARGNGSIYPERLVEYRTW